MESRRLDEELDGFPFELDSMVDDAAADVHGLAVDVHGHLAIDVLPGDASRVVVVDLALLPKLPHPRTFQEVLQARDEVTKDRKMELQRLNEDCDHAFGENDRQRRIILSYEMKEDRRLLRSTKVAMAENAAVRDNEVVFMSLQHELHKRIEFMMRARIERLESQNALLQEQIAEKDGKCSIIEAFCSIIHCLL
jgi:hypothetical protein